MVRGGVVQGGGPCVCLSCSPLGGAALGNLCQVPMHCVSRVFCQDLRSKVTWQTPWERMSPILSAADRLVGITGVAKAANVLHGLTAQGAVFFILIKCIFIDFRTEGRGREG